MGWTYTIETKGGNELLMDCVFQNERLSSFMGIEGDDSATLVNNGRLEITTAHIDRAIKFLTDFNERIKKMPFDPQGDNTTEKNSAIFKEVEKVLCRSYHFMFPWNETDIRWNGFGVLYMIDALNEVKRQMRNFRTNVAYLCYI